MPDNRLYENLRLFLPDASICVGSWQIPMIEPVQEVFIDRWIPLNIAAGRTVEENTGIHMFLHDYQLERLWNRPTKYLSMLQKAGAVCSPDYSMYTDTPTILNMYNHYRKHWLAAYWQRNGINVIPTVCWSDRKSYDWCFDGEPEEGIVAVSSIGTMKKRDDRERFLEGYQEMMKRLNPLRILFMGKVPEGCTGNIIQLPTYTDGIMKQKEEHAGREQKKRIRS